MEIGSTSRLRTRQCFGFPILRQSSISSLSRDSATRSISLIHLTIRSKVMQSEQYRPQRDHFEIDHDKIKDPESSDWRAANRWRDAGINSQEVPRPPKDDSSYSIKLPWYSSKRMPTRRLAKVWSKSLAHFLIRRSCRGSKGQ